jgi:glutamyl-tRNA reductase
LLDDLGVIGVSWRQGSSELLGRYALPPGEEEARLRVFAERAALAELAYLSTCNRVELIFARSSASSRGDLRPLAFELLTGALPQPGEAERRLRAWGGEGAAEHLFLVAAGLDSACVGEAEIVGQVRRSHELSLALGLCGPSLGLLFEEALRISARVRGATGVAEGRLSLAEIAVEALLARVAETPGCVALVGISPMTVRAARTLARSAVETMIVNRTPEKALALARELGAQHLSLEEFLRQPPRIEALLTATAAGKPIFDKSTLEKLAAHVPSGRAPLIVDLAVPGDVPVAAAALLRIPRLGMDEIVRRAQGNRSSRLLEAAHAREHVDEALGKLHETFAERQYGPLFGALQRRYRRTALEGVRRLLRKELRGLGPAEREAIETWAEVLARRFAHIPCLGLRGLVHDGPEGSLEAFLGGLDAEFADELRRALERPATESGQ